MTGLGPVQSMVLQELEDAGGLTEIAAGRSVHRRRKGERHLDHFPEGQPCCEYCVDDGRQVLTSLRERGLVKRRRADGVWTLTVPTSTGQTGEIPW
jgi:hypothetical protein